MRIHNFPVKIYYEDTDAGGIVYHANYLKFMERARTEWLQQLRREMDKKLLFVVKHIELDYLRPARLYDELTVTTRIVDVSGASIVMEQDVCMTKDLNFILCHGLIKIVHIDNDLHVCRLSDEFLETLK
jgi:tol-pal system-associated acyl-CoA thioesterase